MTLYSKWFDTHNEYEAYKNGLNYIRPNVSYCVDRNEMHFNKYINPNVFALKFIPTSPNEDEIIIDCSNISDGVLNWDVIDSNGIPFDAVGAIVIGDCVDSIDEETFMDCGNFNPISISNSVSSIGVNAFFNCRSLSSITIPNSVTYIGLSAFGNCPNIISIIVDNSNSVYDSRNNCNAIIETVSNTLIAGCQNTAIPNTVTTIGDCAFIQCSSLASLTIPNSVTSIGDNAFNGCSNLTTINIPNSVTSIGSYAFIQCEFLDSITVQSIIPPTLGIMAFEVTNNCPIYVPSESVNAYKAATNWTTYASRIQAIP